MVFLIMHFSVCGRGVYEGREYDAFLYDPTDFVVRSYWPRIYGSLKGFETLPRLSNILSYYLGGVTGFMFFGTPQGKDAS